MILEEIDRAAHRKGIWLMGTGDFTHPVWFSEIKEKLEPAEPGLFRLKKEWKRQPHNHEPCETRFMLTSEVSNIYSRDGRVYRVHNLIFAPDLETVEKISRGLARFGTLRSDGRPMLGLDSRELVKIVLGANPEAVVIPAHAWTPWFSVFGSMSGFDSLEECYGEYTKHIFAIETGLSSDPPMNWRLSKLDNITLISNSDSHSLKKIGREANIFDVEPSYNEVINAIRTRDPEKFVATIEFFPEEGKYHFDGHRNCGVVLSPEETKKQGEVCSHCGRKLTIGVMNRVETLADRPGIRPEFKDGMHQYRGRIPYYSLVPLDEIIAKVYGVGVATRRVSEAYDKLVWSFSNEFAVLLNTPLEELVGAAGERVVDGIKAVREGRIGFSPPGYDGEFGRLVFLGSGRQQVEPPQKSLF